MNKPLKWLLKVPGNKKWYVLVLTLLHTLSSVMGVYYALFFRDIVDSATARNSAGFKSAIIHIALLFIIQLGIGALSRWLNMLARSDLENCFKQRLTRCILQKDYASVAAVHTGEWMNRLTNDTVVVSRAYAELLPGFIGTLVRLLAALVMIIKLDSWFAYILVPGGIILVVITYAFRGRLKKLHKNIQEKDGRLRVFLQERIGSLMMIKSFSAEESTEALAAEHMNEHKKARMKRNRLSNLSSVGMGLAMHGMYLIGVIYCAYGIMKGRVSYGTLTAVMHLISQVQSPFANISGYVPRWYAMIASAERLMEAESFPDDAKGEKLSAETVNSFYKNELAAFGLDDVCFTYLPTSELGGVTVIEGGAPEAGKANMPIVLDGMDIRIEKGEYVAFTGHSGCGKSTALKLLMCMYAPDSGRRFIEDRSGGMRELGPEWRRMFAYVPQGNMLMSGTIREIVSFAQPSSAENDEKLMRALDIACADDFLPELENGVDTLLGERGTGLSEGQMQRIAIARAIFSEDPVLLLDEATSALDEATEKRLLTNLRALTDRTVIIVTHRPAVLSICDRVLRFTEDGIAEAEKTV